MALCQKKLGKPDGDFAQQGVLFDVLLGSRQFIKGKRAIDDGYDPTIDNGGHDLALKATLRNRTHRYR